MLALLVYRGLDFRGNGRYIFPCVCVCVYTRFRDEIHSRLRLLDFTVKLKSNFYICIYIFIYVSIFLLFQLNNERKLDLLKLRVYTIIIC